MRKALAAIERDDFASAEVKKLSGSKFYRAKLDYENRLLLKFVQYAGETTCLALELIENQAYDRSRFLRGARLDEALMEEMPRPGSAQFESELEPVRYIHTSRAEFHLLDKPISFDDRQEELYRLNLPLVLVGCAGSGKTALTLTKLRDLPGDVLYVTQSPYLAESAQNLYFAHGYQATGQSVDFLSYRALLESVAVPVGRPVTLADFKSFFRRHEQTLRFTTAHQLFEEIRGVLGADPGGCLSLEQYLARGVRQSIYAHEHRPAVYAAFTKYRAFLKEAALFDSNLLAHDYRSRMEPRYDAVVVDEVQDLTNSELSLVLAALKQREQFLLCGDANQVVHPNFFAWAGVKSLFYSEEQAALTAPIHVLDVNYRSSRAVCSIANDLLKIKNARFGSIDRESTALVRPASAQAGKLLGLVKKDSVLRELNQRTKGSVNVAVIVLSDERKAEARQKFATPLVFTIHEAKGLEYEAVILYDIVSSERARFREVCDGVSPAALETTELEYARARDKSDKSLEVFKFFVNALYVALTRAVDTVYVIESDISHPLLSLLRLTFGEDLSCVESRTSSLEEWQKEARRLELQGKAEQAEAIRAGILRLTPVPWPVLDRAALAELHQRSFMPGSVFGKAKQRLFEFAAFHGLGKLCCELHSRAKYLSPKLPEVVADQVRSRSMGPFLEGSIKTVLSEVGRYGVEYKSMIGLTPLMMAADVGDVPLVEALLERGARCDAVDTLGRMPVHFALRRAFNGADFARDKLGALFALLCPPALDIELEGRRLQLNKNQGEFLLLLMMVARFHELYAGMRRYRGFSAQLISEEILSTFPRNVIPEERRRRVYWNGVLARGEVSSAYRPQRKLWRRERQGEYVPNPSVCVRVAEASGAEATFVPLAELLGLHLLEPELVKPRVSSALAEA